MHVLNLQEEHMHENIKKNEFYGYFLTDFFTFIFLLVSTHKTI